MFRIISLRAVIKQAGKGGRVAILVSNNINFGIADTCSSIDTDNETITIILKDSQYYNKHFYYLYFASIYLLLASSANTKHPPLPGKH